MKRKKETFIYLDLGFPIKLVNAPMKQMLGEWFLDINMEKLQLEVLHRLIHQLDPLQSDQLRFIRKYFELSTTRFGKLLGVSHAAVIKWENGNLPSPPIDFYIRMFVLESLKAKNEEFGKLYREISLESLANSKQEKKKAKPLVVDVYS